jgi:hypothetical protein
LTPSGRNKLWTLARHQTEIAYDSADAWSATYYLLNACDGLDAADVEVSEEPTPVANPLDALEEMDLSSREGVRASQRVVSDAVFGVNGEARNMYRDWLRHLDADYGFSPDEQQQKAAIKFFQDFNRSWLDFNAYNECRRYLVAAKIFPDIRTNDERLAAAVESTDVPLDTYGARQEFARRSRLINQH